MDRPTRSSKALYICSALDLDSDPGAFSIFRTPTDIFPNINIPVVSIVWSYTGLNAQDMSDRIVSVTERTLTTTVDNIEHIESQSLNGIAVVKVFFQPSASVERAIAQVTAVSQTQLRQLPQGTTPLVISYSASSVPILQLALSGGNSPSSNSMTTA